MNSLVRQQCVISGVEDLEDLHSFERFPVFMGCTDGPAEEDLFAPMTWSISKSSGLIQLKELVPLEILYPESHGAGEVGELWRQHHQELARFLNKVSPDAVFEIGGAHGILESEHREEFGAIPWTILEPNPHPAERTQAKFIRGFFDETFSMEETFDTLVHSHLFEHVYDPNAFMDALANFCPEGTNLVFSLPNMAEMMLRKYTNCVNFEHSILLTEPYIEFLLASRGFELVEKQYFRDDHSIFYSAIRRPSVVEVPLEENLYSRYKDMYLGYVAYHEALVEDLNERIDASDLPTFIFGAHVFTQYLIAFGLQTASCIGVLDNNPSKAGRRLYGTDLKVYLPSVLRGYGAVNVVLKAGVYNQEIKEHILQNVNSDCVFLE
ncbi:class I SAM-dependent methyltransferase [Pontimonas sp.]|nr:class I SAM-dependent methyltransferase [Pontimonas sp.]MDA8862995.1 class I SAM-dependent methyltransferase [Pontimonas sp.]